MKLTTFILLITLIQCSASSYGQKVNLKESRASLEQILTKIGKQTGYGVFYDAGDVDNKTVSINLHNASLNEALNACLQDTYLTYKIVGQNIILQVKSPDENTRQTKPPVRVAGLVMDENNKPLPGVSIRVKNSTSGTVSGENGRFVITTPSANSVLVFSFVGYDTQEVTSVSEPLTVKLVPRTSALNDVVVTGYTTQRKIDLTGSVASVSGAVLNERSTPNAANLLSGTIPGLDVVQSNGQPGKDAPNLLIRGLGSFGAGASPLILVDGIIVNDLNSISGNDIESVSVLKDAASAAIYGNRAANGVILVTTKRGKAGPVTINYNNDFSINQATRLPNLIWNSAEYMTLYNQAREHSNQTDIYTPAQIAAYQNAPANSAQYPNFNWIKYYIHNSFSQNHHISVSGGNENTTFNIAAGYLNQNGIISGTNANRYNVLFSIDSKLNKIFKAGATISLSRQDITEPADANSDLILLLYGAGPTYSPFLPDGSGRIAKTDYLNNGAGHNRSIQTVLDNGNRITNNYQARTQVYLQADLAKGLSWMVKGAFNYDDQYYRIYQFALNQYAFQPDASGNYALLDNGSPGSLGVSNQDTRQFYANAYTTLNYQTTFSNSHHLKAFAGFSAESYTDQYLYGQRSSFPNYLLTQLDAGSVTGQNLGGNQYQYALESFFGQVNYDYKGKYLLQIDGRNDGTSRISPSKRWGFFPAASVGWRVSSEDFMKDITWLDNLKFRASYGRLGNQNIGYYPYQALLSTTQYSYNPASGVSQGVYQPNLNNPDIQWEKTDNTDIGMDLSVKHGLFSLTADYYNKKTTGILFTPNILQAVGLNAPVENAGTVQNRGFELDLGHANHIGEFRYSVNVLFSLNRNKVLYLANGTQDDGMYINQVGLPYGSYYMLKQIGIYQSQQEIDSYAKEAFATPKPGDLKFADTNGDGKIDANDRQVVSGQFPNYTYSFRLNVGYKNWDLTTFWQGVQGVKHYVSLWGIDPFQQGGAPPVEFRNAWTPTNPSQTVPAIYTAGYSPNNNSPSTYFLRDASYLRLKNIRLTYHIDPNVLKKVSLKNATIFISGDNLLTFTKFPGDPERLQTGPINQSAAYNPSTNASYSGAYDATSRLAVFPQVRMFTAGLNVTF